MTFDRAGLNISGRLHPCPKAQEPVMVQFPVELNSFAPGFREVIIEIIENHKLFQSLIDQ
jgi:hypothetical protein